MIDPNPTDEIPLLSDDLPDADFRTLLDTRQLSTDDVVRVVGITRKQLEHAIDPARNIVRVSGWDEPRVQGKRRLFSGLDAIKIATVFAANAAGFPQRFTSSLVEQVVNRCFTIQIDIPELDLTPGYVIITWQNKAGDDWNLVTLHKNRRDEPNVPVAFISIHVDRLILEMREKIKATVNEEEIPSFDVPDTVVDNIYSAEEDFFCKWDQENKGCMVGLTLEETIEYNEMREDKIKKLYNCDRFYQLAKKHETARRAEMWKRHPRFPGDPAGDGPSRDAPGPQKESNS